MSRLLVCFALLFIGCQKQWYRSLPTEREVSTHNFYGLWQKKTNPRSPINSSWHKNWWSEKIHLRQDQTFVKIYESEDLIGKISIRHKVEGKGTFRTHKNWILLETKQIEQIEWQGEELKKKESKEVDSALLYYYYLDGNLIIPMIYDMGYNEKDFGVKDGVFIPYDEKNFNFFQYIKIYAFKEFQSHAYYLGN